MKVDIEKLGELNNLNKNAFALNEDKTLFRLYVWTKSTVREENLLKNMNKNETTLRKLKKIPLRTFIRLNTTNRTITILLNLKTNMKNVLDFVKKTDDLGFYQDHHFLIIEILFFQNDEHLHFKPFLCRKCIIKFTTVRVITKYERI